MKSLSHKAIKLVLVSAFAAPLALFAAENATDDHASHHPAVAQSENIPVQVAPRSFEQLQQKMQVRMRAMQQITDPPARAAIMAAQMQDMQEMMQGAGIGCPMAGRMGTMMGMMGMGGGMMHNNMHGNAVK